MKKRCLVSFGRNKILFSLIPFFLILSTVFIIDSSLAHGVVSGKYFWFYGSMGLVTVATLILSSGKKQSFRVSLTDGFVLLFTGSVFLSAWMFGDVSTNTTKLALLALLLVLYLSLRVLLTGDRQKVQQLICFFILITGLVEAVWGLQQLYGFKSSQHALFKLTGSFFNPGPYAGYLAVVLPLAVYYWVQGSRYTVHESSSIKRMLATTAYRTPQLIAGITCIVILITLPSAMSRASWLAAIAGILVVVWSKYQHRVPCVVYRTPVIITILLLIAVGLAGMYYLKKDSADGRLLTWKVSLATFAKNPLGVGLGHFPGAYGDEQAAYFASGMASETEKYVAGNPEYGFNEFLQIGVESGIISLLLFIGVLVCAFRGLARNKHWGMMGSLTALLVFACFSYPFSILPFPIILVFILAMSENNGAQSTRIKRSACMICVSSFCLLFTVFCLWKQYPTYRAYKQWNRQRMYYQSGLYREAAQGYEPLYCSLGDRIQFLFEYGRSLSQSGQPEKSNEVLLQSVKISCDPMLYNIMGKNYQAMKAYDSAEASLLKSTRIVPSRLYPYYLLMKLYVETGDEEKAREAAGIVLTKEPKVQSQAVREMREEAKKVLK